MNGGGAPEYKNIPCTTSLRNLEFKVAPPVIFVDPARHATFLQVLAEVGQYFFRRRDLFFDEARGHRKVCKRFTIWGVRRKLLVLAHVRKLALLALEVAKHQWQVLESDKWFPQRYLPSITPIAVSEKSVARHIAGAPGSRRAHEDVGLRVSVASRVLERQRPFWPPQHSVLIVPIFARGFCSAQIRTRADAKPPSEAECSLLDRLFAGISHLGRECRRLVDAQ